MKTNLEEIARVDRLLQLTMEISHAGTWHVLLSSGRIFWSEQVCRMHGLPQGMAPTLAEAARFYTPESRVRLLQLLEDCSRLGLSFDERLEVISGTGRRVVLRCVGEAVRDAQGEIVSIHGLYQSTDPQKPPRNEADRHALRVAHTLERITDAIYTVDRDWRINFINREAERLMQRPRESLLGKILWDEFADLVDTHGYRECQRAIRENCPVVFEDYYAPYDAWFEVRVYPSEEGAAVYFRDISEARKTAEALRVNEARFMVVSRIATDAIWDFDLVSGQLWRSDNMNNLFGYSPEDYDGGVQVWLARVHPDDRTQVVAGVESCLGGNAESWSAEYRFQRSDGSYAEVLDRAVVIRDASGRAVRAIGAMVDLTERKEAERKQRLADERIREQASLLDKAKDAIVVMDMDFRVAYWNKGAERLYGWTAEETIGRVLTDLLHQDRSILDQARRRVQETGEWSGELTERRKDGTSLPVEVNWTLVRDESGAPKTIFAIKSDISRRKLAENRIRHLAYYDTLTGLPNRQMLMDRLQDSLGRRRPSGPMGALLFIDLDNFKTLNDTLGHDSGDLLLQLVAKRLSGCVRGGDMVARLGGDEFVLILESLASDAETSHQQASQVGSKIVAALNQPFQLGTNQHYATPSIGVALFNDEHKEIGELLKRADLAMYQAKGAGRNTVRFFTPDMQSAVASRAALELDIQQGLREKQFVLNYEPRVDTEGQLTGVDAVVAWNHPRRGLVMPAEFMPLAEETGLMLQLGKWVLETACTQLAMWRNYPDLDGLEMAVQVSARHFHHPEFADLVLSILDQAGIEPGRLKLELSESLLAEDFDDMLARMHTLKARGVEFSLDDFGPGYSSLTPVKSLPTDSFIEPETPAKEADRSR